MRGIFTLAMLLAAYTFASIGEYTEDPSVPEFDASIEVYDVEIDDADINISNTPYLQIVSSDEPQSIHSITKP